VAHEPVVGIIDLLELDGVATLIGVGLQRALAEGALYGALLRVVTAELLAAEDGAKLLELGLVEDLIVLRVLPRHPWLVLVVVVVVLSSLSSFSVGLSLSRVRALRE
jgi:hypothetical protein